MNGDAPSRYKARYARSMAAEIEKNVDLKLDENVLYSGRVRERRNWLIAQPGLLILTPFRIIFLEHNLLSADWIREIPRTAVTRVSIDDGRVNSFVEIQYSDGLQQCSLRLQKLKRGYASPQDNQQLFSALNAFLAGNLGFTVSK